MRCSVGSGSVASIRIGVWPLVYVFAAALSLISTWLSIALYILIAIANTGRASAVRNLVLDFCPTVVLLRDGQLCRPTRARNHLGPNDLADLNRRQTNSAGRAEHQQPLACL